MSDEPDNLGPCPICGRDMIEGASVNTHHWVPKSYGGTAASKLHTICHRMIHEVIPRKDLATDFATPDAIRAHPDMAGFIKWVRKKPVDYVDWPKSPRKRNARR